MKKTKNGSILAAICYVALSAGTAQAADTATGGLPADYAAAIASVKNHDQSTDVAKLLMSYLNDRQTGQIDMQSGYTIENWDKTAATLDLTSDYGKKLLAGVVANPVGSGLLTANHKVNHFISENFTTAQKIELAAWAYGPDVAEQLAQKYVTAGVSGSALAKDYSKVVGSLANISAQFTGAKIEHELTSKIDNSVKNQLMSKLVAKGLPALELGTLSNDKFSEVTKQLLGVSYNDLKKSAHAAMSDKIGFDISQLSISNDPSYLGQKFDLGMTGFCLNNGGCSETELLGGLLSDTGFDGTYMIDNLINESVASGFENAISPDGLGDFDMSEYADLADFNKDDFHMSSYGYGDISHESDINISSLGGAKSIGSALGGAWGTSSGGSIFSGSGGQSYGSCTGVLVNHGGESGGSCGSSSSGGSTPNGTKTAASASGGSNQIYDNGGAVFSPGGSTGQTPNFVIGPSVDPSTGTTSYASGSSSGGYIISNFVDDGNGNLVLADAAGNIMSDEQAAAHMGQVNGLMAQQKHTPSAAELAHPGVQGVDWVWEGNGNDVPYSKKWLTDPNQFYGQPVAPDPNGFVIGGTPVMYDNGGVVYQGPTDSY